MKMFVRKLRSAQLFSLFIAISLLLSSVPVYANTTTNKPVTKTTTTYYSGTKFVKQSIQTTTLDEKKHGKEITTAYDSEGGLQYTLTVPFVKGKREGVSVREQIEDSGWSIKLSRTTTPYKKDKVSGISKRVTTQFGTNIVLLTSDTTYVNGVKQGKYEKKEYSSDGKLLQTSTTATYRNNKLEGNMIEKTMFYTTDEPDESDVTLDKPDGTFITVTPYKNGTINGDKVEKRFNVKGKIEYKSTTKYVNGEESVEITELYDRETAKLYRRTVYDFVKDTSVTSRFKEDGVRIESITTVNNQEETYTQKTFLFGGHYTLMTDFGEAERCYTAKKAPCNGVIDGATYKDGLLDGPYESSYVNPETKEKVVYIRQYTAGKPSKACEQKVYLPDNSLIYRSESANCEQETGLQEIYNRDGSLAVKTAAEDTIDQTFNSLAGMIYFSQGITMTISPQNGGTKVRPKHSAVDETNTPLSGLYTLKNDILELKANFVDGLLEGSVEQKVNMPSPFNMTAETTQTFVNGIITGKSTMEVSYNYGEEVQKNRVELDYTAADKAIAIEYSYDKNGIVDMSSWIEYEATDTKLKTSYVDVITGAANIKDVMSIIKEGSKTIAEEVHFIINDRTAYSEETDMVKNYSKETYYADNGMKWTLEYVGGIDPDYETVVSSDATDFMCVDANGKACQGKQTMPVYEMSTYEDDKVVGKKEYEYTINFVNGKPSMNDLQTQDTFDVETGLLDERLIYTMADGYSETQETIIYEKGKPVFSSSIIYEWNNEEGWVEQEGPSFHILADGARVDTVTYDCKLNGKPCSGKRKIPSANQGEASKNFTMEVTFLNGKINGSVKYTYYRSDNKTIKSTRTLTMKNGKIASQ
jgi:hypothetical protein